MTMRVTFHNMNNQSPYIFEQLVLGKLAFQAFAITLGVEVAVIRPACFFNQSEKHLIAC